MREQPIFALDTAAESRERTVGADHPVAGNDDGDGVAPIRETDRS